MAGNLAMTADGRGTDHKRERGRGALSNLGLKPGTGRSITVGNSLLLDCPLLEKGGKGVNKGWKGPLQAKPSFSKQPLPA